MLYSILIVEDNDLVSQAIALLLPTKEGFDVVRAAKLVDAQQKLREARYDCILLDLNLPDSKGTQTFKEVKKMTTSPILVCTGEEAEDLESIKQELEPQGTKVISKVGNSLVDIASAIIDAAATARPSLALTGKAMLQKRTMRGGNDAQIAVYIAAGTSVVFVVMFIVGFAIDACLQLKQGKYDFPNWAMLVVSPALALVVHRLFKDSSNNSK